ncbi:MAG: 5'-nucleotidase C-terminal domain-containing protein [Lachnospirales bacterium]
MKKRNLILGTLLATTILGTPIFAEAKAEVVEDPVIATSTVTYLGKDSLKNQPKSLLKDSAIPDLINTVQLENSGADISATPIFSPYSNIPKGDVTAKTIKALYPTAASLKTYKITGENLKKYLELSVSYYNQLKNGDLTISFANTDVTNLDFFSGINYTIKIKNEVGNRIIKLTKDTVEIKPEDVFTIAINSNKAIELLDKEIIKTEDIVSTSEKTIQELLVDYVTNKELKGEIDGNWSLHTVPDVSTEEHKAIQYLVDNKFLQAPGSKKEVPTTSLNINDDINSEANKNLLNSITDSAIKSEISTMIDNGKIKTAGKLYIESQILLDCGCGVDF